ncbi:hypothetical protein [Chitinophaga nivalis]|uniref:DUF2946 domain-containing protein n=1 Tax=Chitinophaga nivalis TaxID=2991709 RepID=A0ABT3IJX3_9BACT|nr:hypothetical protein [Chitinophaga nivalis]MCW3466052.1 hypothetical protein [Chitinophaga nivalis]MCW3484257.1 hypothetical protein [Chitinophaga nivalis]
MYWFINIAPVFVRRKWPHGRGISAVLLLLLLAVPAVVETIHGQACISLNTASQISRKGKHTHSIHLPYKKCNLCEVIKQQVHDSYLLPPALPDIGPLPVYLLLPDTRTSLLGIVSPARSNKGPPDNAPYYY